MPEKLPPDRVEGPVGLLGVHEDDPDTGVLLVGVGPHVEVAIRPLGVTARGLEPRVLVAGVVHHEVGDDAYAAGVRLADELAEVLDGAEFRLGTDIPIQILDAGHDAAVAQKLIVFLKRPPIGQIRALTAQRESRDSIQTRRLEIGVDPIDVR